MFTRFFSQKFSKLYSPPVLNNKKNALCAGLLLTIAGTAFWYSKVSAAEKKIALDPKEWRTFPLAEKIPVSHNSNIYRFTLQSPQHELDLPVSSYILIEADLGEEKPVVRPYTPITYDEKGYFDLLIKTYPQGKISKYINNVAIGDRVKIKGPNKTISITPNLKKNIGMIAGGTGITPMLQVIHEILKNPEDKTQITLLFANVTEGDILLRDRIDDLTKKHKNLKVHYTLDNPPPGWKHGKGFVTDEMVKSIMPGPGNDTLILVCGPPPMVSAISGPKTEKYEQGELKGVLKRLGYNESQVFKF